ncbi:MAG: leucine-rich repeat protein, partial [Thermoguttaceae bacterium]|nr:leucine-rich repeat protein [Thermoguttaceae bacterium]
VNLSEAYFNDGLRTVGPRAFKDSNLKKISLPQSVDVIHDQAFENVRAESVRLPTRLPLLGQNVFDPYAFNNVTYYAPPPYPKDNLLTLLR